MLSVRNGKRAINFYRSAFHAEEVFRIEDEKNESVVARLSVEEAEFWVADEAPEHSNFSPETLGGGSVRMVLVVGIQTLFSLRLLLRAEKWSGQSRTTTDGVSVEWSIRSVIIGRLESHSTTQGAELKSHRQAPDLIGTAADCRIVFLRTVNRSTSSVLT